MRSSAEWTEAKTDVEPGLSHCAITFVIVRGETHRFRFEASRFILLTRPQSESRTRDMGVPWCSFRLKVVFSFRRSLNEGEDFPVVRIMHIGDLRYRAGAVIEIAGKARIAG